MASKSGLPAGSSGLPFKKKPWIRKEGCRIGFDY